MRPLISIIIPCYNSAEYLPQCMKSLEEQTIGLENLQLIFVDDASTDGGETWQCILEFEQKHPLQVIAVSLEQNRAQGGARNVGIEYAAAEYIGFVDSDDYLDNRFFEILVSLIVEYDSDITRYVANALAPARLLSYEVNREKKQIQVWTTEDQLSIAIGKRGHNARLTSQLTGWRVDIDSEAPEPSGFDTQVANAILELEKIPGITEDCARKLVLSGFTNANAILQTDLADLQSIEGIGDMAESIIEAVRAAVVNSPSDDK